MSMEERTGQRDLLYSGWHRPSRVREWLSVREAAMLTQIDIDWCEYCCFCQQPIALIETQESSRAPKPAKVTGNLAEMAGIPAYSVSYTRSDTSDDIALFHVQQIRPVEHPVSEMLPQVYAYWLLSLRDEHNRHYPDCGEKCWCGGAYMDTDIGHDSHEVVMGHRPAKARDPTTDPGQNNPPADDEPRE